MAYKISIGKGKNKEYYSSSFRNRQQALKQVKEFEMLNPKLKYKVEKK